MRPLIELSTEQYESPVNQAGEALPLELRLKNAVRTQAGTVAILCDLDEAETLLQVAKQFCPGAMPQIEKAIRLGRPAVNRVKFVDWFFHNGFFIARERLRCQ